MKLTRLTWSRYHVPFRATFYTAHGALSYRTGALVTLLTDNGYAGHGEIAPLPEQSGPGLDEALATLPALTDALRDQSLFNILRFLASQSADGLLPAPLIYGLETALFDALGQAHNLRVADLLACDDPFSHEAPRFEPRTRIPVNAVTGGSSLETTLASARAAITAGFTCLKLKLTDTSQQALERVAAVRSAIGLAPRLRLDANASWSREQAYTFLPQLAAYDIEYIEQPLAAHDLAGMADLRRVTPIPLAVDEALTGLESARRVLRARAADVLILKPQLAGGLRVCRRIIQEASQQGIDCVITSTLETGVGVTAALHLAAASPEITRACGLATLHLLESDLLQTSLTIQQGMAELPVAPGLGTHLDQDIIDSFTQKLNEGH